MQISVACFYLLAPLTPFSGHFRERFENKHCGFHVCIILNWIDLCGVTRQAPSVLAVMLFLHPRELRNIRTDRSLKGAVIDSLKLKQMFWPLLACQWLRTRCGMKDSPQKGKNEREVKSIRCAFCATSLYSSTWKRVWCFGHKSTSESHAGWLRCSSRNLLET